MSRLRIERSRLKLLLAFVLFLLLAASAGVLLAVGGKAIFIVERGGTAAPIENVIVDLEEQEPGRVTWVADASTVRRPIDLGTRERIADAYLRGWRQVERALATCSTRGISMYFGPGPAAQLEELVSDARASGCHARRTDGSHRLRLTFVSEDGGLVAVTDEHHWYVDRIPVDGDAGRYLETSSARDLVLRLDDGEWRVAAWDQRPVLVEADRTAADPRPAGLVTARQRQLAIGGVTYTPVGVNYYPADTPWRAFWAEYEPSVIDEDLAQARALGFDAVRIFVPFGSGPIRPTDDLLVKLDDFLERAEAQELRVVVTLFDLDFDYRPAAWVAADRYLERLLTRFAEEPAILAWDLKNEPDLDDGRFGRTLVDAWLRHVIATARRHDPHHLITVGWSATRWADRLAGLLDVVSVHDYGDPATLADRLEAAADATPDQPLWLSEFGASSWQSPLVPGGAGEQGQAAHLAAARRSIGSLPTGALAGDFVWALRDHDLEAPAPDGVRPWRRGIQRSFGLIRVDGTLKPAATAIPDGAEPGTLAFGPYRTLLLVVTLLGAVLAILARWRRRLTTAAAFALVFAHPAAFVVLGLGVTVLGEMLRIDVSRTSILAAVTVAGASAMAWFSVRFLGRLVDRLVRTAARWRGPARAPVDGGSSPSTESAIGSEL